MGASASSLPDDCVILVTGASRGIGKICMEHLRQEFPRAHVYGAARSGVKVEAIIDSSQLLAMDVTSDDSVAAAIALILRKHKRIDVVVNNAGINQANVLRTVNVASAMNPMNTNFAGVIRVNEKVIPSMIESGRGLIINVGSIAGRLGLPYQGMYSASKAALASYTDSLCMELRRHQIRVCLFEPGDMRPGQPTTYDDVTAADKAAMRALARMHEDEKNGSDPIVFARAVCNAIRKNVSGRFLIGIDANLVACAQRLLPHSCQMSLLAWYYGASRKD